MQRGKNIVAEFERTVDKRGRTARKKTLSFVAFHSASACQISKQSVHDIVWLGYGRLSKETFVGF